MNRRPYLAGYVNESRSAFSDLLRHYQIPIYYIINRKNCQGYMKYREKAIKYRSQLCLYIFKIDKNFNTTVSNFYINKKCGILTKTKNVL